MMMNFGISRMGQSFSLDDLLGQAHIDFVVVVKVRNFFSVANAASKLTHVNLVSVFENSQQGNAYIAMELVQGRNLAQILEATGILSLEQFQEIFTQVCDGLLHAHAKGIVHRDISPAIYLSIQNAYVLN